jgi:hypothetical protein
MAFFLIFLPLRQRFKIGKCGAKFKILKRSKQILSPFIQQSTLVDVLSNEFKMTVAFFLSSAVFFEGSTCKEYINMRSKLLFK